MTPDLVNEGRYSSTPTNMYQIERIVAQSVHAAFVALWVQVHLDPALEPSKMTGDEIFVFGLHPHGVLSDYRILLDGVTAEHFPKVGGD